MSQRNIKQMERLRKKKKQHKPNEENILVKRALTLMVQICQIR